MKRKVKVFWTTKEMTLVVDEVVRLTKITPKCDDIAARGVLRRLTMMAQTNVLPKDRHRSPNAPLGAIEEGVLERLTKPSVVASVTKPAASAPTANPVPVSPTTPAADAHEELKTTPTAWQRIRAEVMKTPVIQTLIDSLAEEIFEEARARASVKIATIPATVASPAGKQAESRTTVAAVPVTQPPAAVVMATPPVSDAPRKPLVVIVGVTPARRADLYDYMSRIENDIDMEAYPVDNISRHFNTISKADLVIHMSGRVPGKVLWTIKNLNPRYYLVGANVTEPVIDIINYVESRFKLNTRGVSKAPAVRRPRVVIMGLLAGQFQDLVDEFKDRLDLALIGSDDLKRADVCTNAKVTLMLRKFISHKHSVKVAKLTDNWEYVNGGMTELRSRLTELAAA